ncbi:hypothetical protein GCM10022220_28630 [Actinocatenispora rupis]|uniref:SnoaL-like domain-containing protein n=2 Tax=Actinocatenispora rupis TaxID=519421 RepID=A0A8J3NC63_9ACTN|nr:hypothetical protein Aru02nite_24290 [Actinocatenispora rupis]
MGRAYGTGMKFDIDAFAERYVAVWHEPDPVVRKESVAALWAADGTQATEESVYRGHEALTDRVASAYEQLVRDGGYVFRSAGDVVGHHDTVTFTIWMVPAAGGPVEWAGRMVLLLDADGRIREDFQYTLPVPPCASTRAIAEAFVRRLADGNPEDIGELFADEVEWVLDWPDEGHPAVPWIRPRHTRADVVAHFREIAAHHAAGGSAAPEPHLVVHDTDAVLLGEIRQTVRATGREYAAKVAVHLTVEDGRITRYAVYEDSLTVARALAGE